MYQIFIVIIILLLFPELYTKAANDNCQLISSYNGNCTWNLTIINVHDNCNGSKYKFEIYRKIGWFNWSKINSSGETPYSSYPFPPITITVGPGEYRSECKCRRSSGWTTWKTSNSITLNCDSCDCNSDSNNQCGFWGYCKQGECITSYDSSGLTLDGTCVCFPEDTEVILPGGRKKKIQNLKIGDIVTTIDSGNVSYSKITTFIHKNIDKKSAYITIILNNGKRTTASPKHLIYANGNYITTESVKIGDNIQYIDGNIIREVMVAGLEKNIKTGLYAPLTETGTIVIDNIHYSCYANYGIMDNIRNSHEMANIAMAPLRYQTCSSKQNEIHWYAQALMNLA